MQEILNQTASRAKARLVKAYTPNLFKGKVFCAHCGGSLHRQRNIRKKSDDVYFYHCLSQIRISKDACPGVTIREDAPVSYTHLTLRKPFPLRCPQRKESIMKQGTLDVYKRQR